jgi:hypothetical protein
LWMSCSTQHTMVKRVLPCCAYSTLLLLMLVLSWVLR